VRPTPFDVALGLPGWELYWALLEVGLGHSEELAELRTRVAREARESLAPGSLAADPTVAALRKLFRAAGCDPGRYRPSSEALLRRVLQSEELPWIHALVDLNNCLSVKLRVPCCILDEAQLEPPVALRAGRAGEILDSMRGPLNLEGKPLLEDRRGPFGTPISDSERVKVRPETKRAWLVAYLPAGVVTSERAERELDALLAAAPVARRLR
jgi:DNA/RNA-binding domain of Phe-tRNA-synthetase-like protein